MNDDLTADERAQLEQRQHEIAERRRQHRAASMDLARREAKKRFGVDLWQPDPEPDPRSTLHLTAADGRAEAERRYPNQNRSR